MTAGAEWRVAESIPAPADVMEVAGHQVALMPSLPDQPCPARPMREAAKRFWAPLF